MPIVAAFPPPPSLYQLSFSDTSFQPAILRQTLMPLSSPLRPPRPCRRDRRSCHTPATPFTTRLSPARVPRQTTEIAAPPPECAADAARRGGYYATARRWQPPSTPRRRRHRFRRLITSDAAICRQSAAADAAAAFGFVRCRRPLMPRCPMPPPADIVEIAAPPDAASMPPAHAAAPRADEKRLMLISTFAMLRLSMPRRRASLRAQTYALLSWIAMMTPRRVITPTSSVC